MHSTLQVADISSAKQGSNIDWSTAPTMQILALRAPWGVNSLCYAIIFETMTVVIQYPLDVMHSVLVWMRTQWSSLFARQVSDRVAIAVTVDVIVLRNDQLLLIRRANEPFAHQWALPGGRVEPTIDADLQSAARRELKEETDIDSEQELQLFTAVGNNRRDPRGFTVSTVFVLRLPADDRQIATPADDACEAKWFQTDHLPVNLAFDHKSIVTLCLQQ